MSTETCGPSDQGADEAALHEGGDPVCWLEQVCDACGALSDGPPAPVCPRCGAARP